MHRWSLALNAIFMVAFAQIASAADLPHKAPAYSKSVPVPIFSWTGFYVGGHVGYGWGRTTIIDVDCYGVHEDCQNFDYSFRGAVGGVLGGYNWQYGNVVFGPEFDFSFSGMERTIPGVFAGDSFTTKIEWFGTGRFRIGYAIDRALLFASGGFAYAHVKNSFDTVITGLPLISTNTSGVRWGWTAGGGLEYAIWQNWTIRGEYLFVEIERDGVNDPVNRGCSAVGCRFDWDNDFHIVRAALNYKF